MLIPTGTTPIGASENLCGRGRRKSLECFGPWKAHLTSEGPLCSFMWLEP